jgi:hypothetical protein
MIAMAECGGGRLARSARRSLGPAQQAPGFSLQKLW